MADVFALPVQVPEVKEATSLGAALWVLVCLGEYDALAESALALVRWQRTVDPSPCHMAVYQPIVQMALDLQRGLMEWVLCGRLHGMWQAAGADAEPPSQP
jgi:sugar (pentulose or hexulose) kinase